MLSVQSMYKYITQPYRHFGTMDALISKLYDSVRDYAFSQLPEDINVVMVPVPVIRNFVAPLLLKEKLNRKLRFYQQFMDSGARCGKKLSAGELSRPVLWHLRQKRETLFNAISEPLARICADSETGVFYSQHDLDQDDLYIPDQVMELPIRAMLDIASRMRRLSA
jgi:hypothetical protein